MSEQHGGEPARTRHVGRSWRRYRSRLPYECLEGMLAVGCHCCGSPLRIDHAKMHIVITPLAAKHKPAVVELAAESRGHPPSPPSRVLSHRHVVEPLLVCL